VSPSVSALQDCALGSSRAASPEAARIRRRARCAREHASCALRFPCQCGSARLKSSFRIFRTLTSKLQAARGLPCTCCSARSVFACLRVCAKARVLALCSRACAPAGGGGRASDGPGRAGQPTGKRVVFPLEWWRIAINHKLRRQMVKLQVNGQFT
jgi:hypothetical protein